MRSALLVCTLAATADAFAAPRLLKAGRPGALRVAQRATAAPVPSLLAMSAGRPPSDDSAAPLTRVASTAVGAALLLGGAQSAMAARSGGRMGGSVSRGGGGGGRRMGGGGGGYGGGGTTNIIMAPGMGYRPFGYGFSPFGFGYSPFGFGGFGFFSPPSWLILGGLGLLAFRSMRDGLETSGATGNPGAALLLQVGVNCKSRSAASMFGRMDALAASADTSTDAGLQLLVSDTCLALLRCSADWVSARSVSETSGFGGSRDTEAQYRALLVGERAKWENEARRGGSGGSTLGGQTYMVVTVMALLEGGTALPQISSSADLRRALAQLASEVGKEGNLVAADVLWTPQEATDTLSREDMFAYFPELIDI